MSRRIKIGLGIAVCVVLLAYAASGFLSESNFFKSQATRNCLAILNVMVKSPSSLNVVTLKETDIEGGLVSTYIEFDSANEFGTLVRETFECHGPKEGRIFDILEVYYNGTPMDDLDRDDLTMEAATRKLQAKN